MKSKVRLILSIMAICLLSMMAYSVLRAQTKDALVHVNMQTTSSLNISPVLLAIQRGFFARHGLDVTLTMAPDEASIINNVISGKVDIGYVNIVQSLRALDRGHDIVLVHPTYGHQQQAQADPYRIYVSPDGPFTDPRSLAAANIGAHFSDDLPQWITRRALENLGVRDFSRMRWTHVKDDEVVDLVNKGVIDAIWLKQPQGYAAEKAGLRPVMSVNVTGMPGAAGGYFFTARHFSVKHWDLLRKFRRAMMHANLYASKFPSHSRAALATHFNYDPEVMHNIQLNTHPNEISPTHVREISKDLVRYGLIAREPDYKTVFWKE